MYICVSVVPTLLQQLHTEQIRLLVSEIYIPLNFHIVLTISSHFSWLSIVPIKRRGNKISLIQIHVRMVVDGTKKHFSCTTLFDTAIIYK